jgi:ribonuclease BN (tRNA processing enzyme)
MRGEDGIVAEATLTVLGRAGACPQPGEASRGYLLQGDGGAVLVGCGSGVASRLSWVLPDLARLVAVVLPDLRPDHCSDLWVLGSMTACARTAGTRRGLLPVYAFGEPDVLWRGLQRPGVLDVRRFAPGDVVAAGGWRLKTVRQVHPWPGAALLATPPAGDGHAGLVTLGRPTPALSEALRGAGFLLVEVGGPRIDASDDVDEGLAGGMSAAEAAALAASAGAHTLLLSHRHAGDDASELLRQAQAGFPRCEWALEARTYELA